jgi:branched-chain amino acid transport system permease protein
MESRMRTTYKQDLRLLRNPARIAWALLFGAFLLYLPTVLENRTLFGMLLTDTQLLGIGLSQINFALIAVMGAVALNLLIGYTGLLSMGHAAFFAIGAMVAAILSVQHDVPFPLVVLAAGVVGAIVGAIFGLPALRLRGLYLLLSTLSLHFITLYVFMRYQVDNYGPAGITFESPNLFGISFDNDRSWYFLFVVLAGIVLLVSRNLLSGREGRAMIAVRDHDVAAGALGVHVGKQRIKVFALTSFMVSAVGALYVYYLGTATYDSYTLDFVIGYIAMIIIGGMGSLTGAVLGALLWSLTPQILETLSQSVDPGTPVLGDLLGRYQGQTVSLLLGLLVIVILMFKPAGLNGIWLDIKRGVTRWPYSS